MHHPLIELSYALIPTAGKILVFLEGRVRDKIELLRIRKTRNINLRLNAQKGKKYDKGRGCAHDRYVMSKTRQEARQH